MGLGLQLSLTRSQKLHCRYCEGSLDNHEQQCPQAAMERARDARRFLECPVCSKNAVDVNASDYYECRECRSQFSRGAQHEGCGEDKFLWVDGQPRRVVLLSQKGKGKFPSDKSFKKVKKYFKRVKPLDRRKRRRHRLG